MDFLDRVVITLVLISGGLLLDGVRDNETLWVLVGGLTLMTTLAYWVTVRYVLNK